jgi:hypothetical protein
VKLPEGTDGEYSKPGFFTYIRERFDGFEARPNQKLILFQKEVSAFPDYFFDGLYETSVPEYCTSALVFFDCYAFKF